MKTNTHQPRNSIIRTLLFSTALIGCMTTMSTIAQAGPLENLERERAMMLGAAISPTLSPEERQEKVMRSRHRLVDHERIVIRNTDLHEENNPVTRRAFANYDLTFLTHASIEKNRDIIGHWLQELGLSTEALLTARAGRRY